MKLLCPNEIISSISHLDFESLKNLGIKGILMDLDNTLVGWDSQQLSDEFNTWLRLAKKNEFKLCLVSNGVPCRVRQFGKELEIPAVVRALKPRRRPFCQALHLLKLSSDQVVMVGDQIFTDVFGANRLGIRSILIDPLSEKELRSTQFVRKLERYMLRRFVKKGWISGEVVNRRIGGL